MAAPSPEGGGVIPTRDDTASLPVMPTQICIHAFAATSQRNGCRACARYDGAILELVAMRDLGRVAGFFGAALVRPQHSFGPAKACNRWMLTGVFP